LVVKTWKIRTKFGREQIDWGGLAKVDVGHETVLEKEEGKLPFGKGYRHRHRRGEHNKKQNAIPPRVTPSNSRGIQGWKEGETMNYQKEKTNLWFFTMKKAKKVGTGCP